MGSKKKLIRFEENKGFSNLFEPVATELLENPHEFMGNWANGYFNNTNELILELGCGKAEYTTNLARLFPNKNCIGVDIKGSRIYHAAKYCSDTRQTNICFIRSQIDLIDRIFQNEVSQIWITFPDPSTDKARRRLIHPIFLQRYKRIVKPDAELILKTDSSELYEYALETIPAQGGRIILHTADYYEAPISRELPAIQTTYEKRFLAEGKKICLVMFRL